MTFRADSISVTVTGAQSFAGPQVITFSWSPGQDDPLLRALLDKNEELLMAAVRLHPADDIFIG